MARTAPEIIAPLLPEITAAYNPTLHGPDPNADWKTPGAVTRYLRTLTGEEPLEEVLSVTSYGLALGLNRSSLGVHPGNEGAPYYQNRLLLVENFMRALRTPVMEDWRELWNLSDTARYRGVGRSTVRAMSERYPLPAPFAITPNGERLYDPVGMRQWSDKIEKR